MRLIDADALAEELSSLTMTITGLRAGKGVLHKFLTEYRESVLRIVDEAPTIESEPLRHGRWVLVGADKRGRGGVFNCTTCNRCHPHKSDYCPNCGVKMDAKEENT